MNIAFNVINHYQKEMFENITGFNETDCTCTRDYNNPH